MLFQQEPVGCHSTTSQSEWLRTGVGAYIANGDIGIVVGEYKGKKSKFRGLPWKLEVEFAGQLGHKYGFYRGEFGDEGLNPLELAYCLTVHKTQGSEFGTTFVGYALSKNGNGHERWDFMEHAVQEQ